MEKKEIRAVIKFFTLKGQKSNVIKAELDSVLKDSAPSLSTVQKWSSEFKMGRSSCEDELRSGRPTDVSKTEKVENVNKMVLANRGIMVAEIVENVKVTLDRAYGILHQELGLRHIYNKWVPSVLNAEQKAEREEISDICLQLYNRNQTEFLQRFVTAGTTIIYYFPSEQPTPPAMKRLKRSNRTKKALVTVFWDAQGIIFTDFVQIEKCQTNYFESLLDMFVKKLSNQRPNIDIADILLHRSDITDSQNCEETIKTAEELGFRMIPQPTIAPDLSPSDYHLFPNMQKYLCRADSDEYQDTVNVINEYFAKLNPTVFQNGIASLQQRWNKCVELGGDYVKREIL